MTAYAGAVSSTASLESIRDAATPVGADRPAKTTVLRWMDALQRLWLIEPIPAWAPTRNALSRLALAPRHQMADPAFAARLRGATVGTLLDAMPAGATAPRDATLLGALFESLATLSIQVAAQVQESRVGHFRTRNGDHEIDLIVERADGRVVAIEVKLTATPTDHDVRHLHWLRERIGDDLLDAAVITTGPEAYRRRDGIAVIPAALLG
jgi:predicted AAA+ superfamily ATPase